MGQSVPGERGWTTNDWKGGRGLSGKRSKAKESMIVRRVGEEELDATRLTTTQLS